MKLEKSKLERRNHHALYVEAFCAVQPPLPRLFPPFWAVQNGGNLTDADAYASSSLRRCGTQIDDF